MENSFKAGTSFYILMALAYASILWISYWEIEYYLASDYVYNFSPRLSSAMVLYISSPIWVGLPIIAVFKRKKLSVPDMVLSFLPFIAMCGVFASWNVIVQV